VARARQHSLGDLPHRTARRVPGKLAVVAGETRLTYPELDVAISRTANALAARGLVKGDRLALLPPNCWQFAVLVFATARLGVVLVPVNFMLNSGEVAFILGHSGASGIITEDALAPVAEQALASAKAAGGVRGWISLSGAAPGLGWEDAAAWAADGPASAPDVLVADDDHLGHRVAAEGRASVQPVTDRPVRQLRDRRRDDRRGRGAAHAAPPAWSAG
jgi:fatty-acyl-CoA synthase